MVEKSGLKMCLLVMLISQTKKENSMYMLLKLTLALFEINHLIILHHKFSVCSATYPEHSRHPYVLQALFIIPFHELFF